VVTDEYMCVYTKSIVTGAPSNPWNWEYCTSSRRN